MIQLSNISKSYGARVLFSELSYQFGSSERIALVGPNGAGKSTLLHIICKTLEPDTGKVIVPEKVTIGFLPQEPNPTPKPNVLKECIDGASQLANLQNEMDKAFALMEANPTEENVNRYTTIEDQYRQHGGYLLDSTARKLLDGLGFSPSQIEAPCQNLSGGWRMRLELAKIFINEPDFLILDEPTNHLDLPSLAWVESYLERFKGTLLFVSHDRDLLNRLAQTTLELSGGKLTPYSGNFDQYLEQKQERLSQDQAKIVQLQKRRKELEHFVSRFGAKASKAKQAQSKAKMIERLKLMEGEIEIDEPTSELSFSLKPAQRSGRVVLTLQDLTIGFDQPLSKPINLQIERGMRIAVVGANGIGKSTLLKTIYHLIPACSGELEFGFNVKASYFAQDQLEVLDPEKSVLENLLRVNDGVGEGQLRSLLGNFLFRGDDVFKPVSILSGGEKSRVGLVRSLIANANFMLLDEPTNHLDMSSAAILASALASYEGTALFVSHDRSFINAVCTHTFVMLQDGRSQLFEGDLYDYQRLCAVSGFPNFFQTSEPPKPVRHSDQLPHHSDQLPHHSDQLPHHSDQLPHHSGHPPRHSERSEESRILNESEIKELQKTRRRYTEKLKKLEQQIEIIERTVHDSELELAKLDPRDHEKLAEGYQKIEDSKKMLEHTEQEWLQLSEKLEIATSKLKEIGRL